MTPDELPADMEAPARALAMRLERRALEYNERQGHYAYIGDDCALDDRAAQAIRALLKAYQEQRRALEDLLALPVAARSLVHLDKGIGTKTPDAAWLRARAALNQKGKSHD